MSKILIVDDEKDFCFFVKANLEAGGEHSVITATSGRDGLRMAQSNRPDLILLDITMPWMSGFDVLKKLKEDEKTMHIPVIMLTASGDEASKEKAASLFDEDYIVKPVPIDVLRDKVARMLARRR